MFTTPIIGSFGGLCRAVEGVAQTRNVMFL